MLQSLPQGKSYRIFKRDVLDQQYVKRGLGVSYINIRQNFESTEQIEKNIGNLQRRTFE